MFRRVVLGVSAVFISISLTSLAQDSAAQPQAGNSSAPASSASSTPAQPSAKISSPPAHKHSSKSSKKSKKGYNPIANLDSKQPDKALFDRAEDAMKHGKYDVARLSLQTLISTYPDSEYVARAKLAIGDAWYAEGGTAAMSQAESEYKDFITFFPNMPEAAEAQMKIGNIHFREMEKADRDPTHARRAEEEYRQLILNFPDSPLVPQAKERLLAVQEVLARREYLIGHFYYLRENFPAAIARLKSVTDTYPLFSQADDALFELGSSYEREVDLLRQSKLPESLKGTLISQYDQAAAVVYGHIVTRYPLEPRATDAAKRLEALKRPVPTATPEAIAQNKKEIESRGSVGTVGKVMENFHKGPDVSEATKVGEPTLVDPQQASATDMVRTTNAVLAEGGASQVSVEKVGDQPAPAENSPAPHSDAASAGNNSPAAAPDANSAAAAGPAAGTDMKNDLAPNTDSASGAPPVPPTQVNDLAGANTAGSPAPQASAGSTTQPAPPANSDESSSKKKKKRHLLLF